MQSSFRKPLEITNTFGKFTLWKDGEGTRSPENSVNSRHCLFAESLSEALGAQGLTFPPQMIW